MVGGPSMTVTANSARPTRPVEGSVAVHSTSLRPTPKIAPEAGVAVDGHTGTVGRAHGRDVRIEDPRPLRADRVDGDVGRHGDDRRARRLHADVDLVRQAALAPGAAHARVARPARASGGSSPPAAACGIAQRPVVVGARGVEPSIEAHVDVRVGLARTGCSAAASPWLRSCSRRAPAVPVPGGGRFVNMPPLAPRPPKIPARPCGIGKRGGLRSTTMRLVGVSARRAYARKCASISSCVACARRIGSLEEVDDVPARSRVERGQEPDRLTRLLGCDDRGLGADERQRRAPGLLHHAQSPEHVLRIRQRSDRDVLRRIGLARSRSPRRNAGTPPSADRCRR